MKCFSPQILLKASQVPDHLSQTLSLSSAQGYLRVWSGSVAAARYLEERKSKQILS